MEKFYNDDLLYITNFIGMLISTLIAIAVILECNW